MRLEYTGLSDLNGSLVALEGVSGVSYDEMAELVMADGSRRYGRVILIEGDRAVLQVFEGTRGISLENTSTHFTGKPMDIALSKEMLGRVFDGAGRPIDGLGELYPDERRNINGSAINPVSRQYPRSCIYTGVSAIDGTSTLIRGQKLPKNDVAEFFRRNFEESGALPRVAMFLNLASDPIIERILTPRCALTAAEYLAFTHGYHVLVVMTDMTSYCEAVREFSSSKGEIPSRKGFPAYLYSDLASLYERAGMIVGKKGSVTQVPILTMPNDDITHPIPDLTGYITEGQIVLDRNMDQSGVYPPINILSSLSRLMKDGIGEGFTRADHPALSNQLFASYSKVQDARSLASVIGEDELSPLDQQYLRFGRAFEQYFVRQGQQEDRTLEQTLELGWALLSILPKGELDRISDKELEEHYKEGAFESLGEL